MQLDQGDDRPIYLQLADAIEDAIFTGAFAEETQIPSTTEISAQMKINPATVLKGMGQLVDRGILYKKRGVGMFVKEGAALAIQAGRQAEFFEQYVLRMVREARKLGLSREGLLELIERGMDDEQH
ncbi:GntR family transcriptional regulator [Eubacteriales bacterium OttesenSCG-928-A19]|nr:GntR family transcriptional regulator [Eubacteriales bacterium OttesenSCG-928-A19]